MTPRHWVIHLPTRLTSFDAAARLVEQLRDTVGGQVSAAIDFTGATLTEKDRLMVRHPVFCDRPLPRGHRCALRYDHIGACLPLPWQRAS
ncbi:hypothetical protein [Plantactinospora sp. GCM10030261]|uniref:hypothetical protein n=1 Tax=Plantactinospora sp. GCM10030261 TaxID=3273420 RepID=UPI00360CA4A7